jgi:two-component system sensor histidine kinase/response regulator
LSDAPERPPANILIVDDEPHSLLALQQLLCGPDRTVVPARSGKEALRHLLRAEFAIILLDVRMPEMDGFETATLIRELSRCRRTPIIFLTAAMEDTQAMFRGYEIGAVDFIVKPVDSAVLQSKVEVFVDLYNKSAELNRQIARRRSAERELSKANEELEGRIRERTASLIAANELLQKEIGRREGVEERLRGSEAEARRLSLVASRTENAVVIKDSANRIEWINDSFTRMYGYSLDEVKGKDAMEFLRGSESELELARMQTEMSSGRGYRTELTRYSKSGRRYCLAVECRPIADDDGRLTGFIEIASDITERKLSEESLRESEERKSAILELALDCIITMDHDGRILEFNPAAEQTFGYARSHIVGKRAVDLLLPAAAHRGQLKELRRAFSREGGATPARRMEITARRSEGSEFPAELTISVGRLGGKPFFTAYIRDITERKQAESDLRNAMQAAEAANQAKSEFLANMSHEIRTPMNAIIGMTELALQTNVNSEQREYLGVVKASSESLLKVINDILDFSKIEAGRLEVETIPFSLREAVGDTMKTLALHAHRKGLELAYDIGPDTPESVLGDPLRLRQILTNLVDNAIKFTERGEVLVRVEAQEAQGEDMACRFTVRDTGVGIAKEKQATIFAPFLQADTSTTRLYGGTGLGLTISARLVEMMNGRIWVESEPDAGSAFYFTVRLGVQAASKADAAETDFHGLRALVVDDHPATCASLVRTMQGWQMETDEATSGTQALEMIKRASQRQRPYHLVLLDDALLDSEGQSIGRHIRQNSYLGVGALVSLCSPLRREEGEAPAESGHRVSLTKPVKHSELVQALRAALMGAVEPGAPSAAAQAVAETSRQKNKLRILLVEDNPVNRKLAQHVLEKEGHSVVSADNGLAGIEALENRTFDLVLMDVQMPKMDGIEATMAIREKEKGTGGHIPIIALTAHAMAGDRERCLHAGMDGYLMKPIQPATLIAAIERVQLPSSPRLQEGQPEKVVLNRPELLDRVGGDQELLAEVTEMFLKHTEELMRNVRAAIESRDAESLAYSAHTLKGMLANLAARAAQDVAHKLQQLDPQKEPVKAEAAYTLLEQEIKAVKSELAILNSEMCV